MLRRISWIQNRFALLTLEFSFSSEKASRMWWTLQTEFSWQTMSPLASPWLIIIRMASSASFVSWEKVFKSFIISSAEMSHLSVTFVGKHWEMVTVKSQHCKINYSFKKWYKFIQLLVGSHTTSYQAPCSIWHMVITVSSRETCPSFNHNSSFLWALDVSDLQWGNKVMCDLWYGHSFHVQLWWRKWVKL